MHLYSKYSSLGLLIPFVVKGKVHESESIMTLGRIKCAACLKRQITPNGKRILEEVSPALLYHLV